MSRISKLWVKLNKKPTPSDIRMSDAEKLLEAFGFVLARTTGSHCHFKHQVTGRRVTIKKTEQIAQGAVNDIIESVMELTSEVDPIKWLEKEE